MDGVYKVNYDTFGRSETYVGPSSTGFLYPLANRGGNIPGGKAISAKFRGGNFQTEGEIFRAPAKMSKIQSYFPFVAPQAKNFLGFRVCTLI